MNAGMYKSDLSPKDLFIENGIEKTKIDTMQKRYGNIYLQPNGVFYVTNNDIGAVCKTVNFANWFRSIGCKNALYLDGLVSKTYLSKKRYKTLDDNFGVMIGEIENNKYEIFKNSTFLLYDYRSFLQ